MAAARRLVILAALAAAAAWAQPLTMVRDTVYDQAGGLYTGPVTITLSVQSAQAGGHPLLGLPKTVAVRAGALSVALVPNDAITPASTSYVFTFGNGGRKTCTIPTSTPAIALDGHCSDAPPLTGAVAVPLGWLVVPPGTADGTYCLAVAGGAATGLTVCPSSTVHTLFDSAAGMFDATTGLFDAH